jgi:hypothetical protein
MPITASVRKRRFLMIVTPNNQKPLKLNQGLGT